MNASKKAWKCTVCGYIHYGSEPPGTCPVCGATSNFFEALDDSINSNDVGTGVVDQWRCLNCEYIHKGPSPPDFCPVCSAIKDSFEVYQDNTEENEGKGDENLHIVIAGSGIAGVSAGEAIRKIDRKAHITILSKETHLPYYRLNLTRYLAGEIEENQLLLHEEDWYLEQGIRLEQNCELCSIDRESKAILLKSGKTINYDKLIMTMGSHPFIPPIPGSNKENVTALRTKKDADFILEKCRKNISVVIIGGGLLGLEAAGALAQRGLDVTLLEGSRWLLPRQLNERAGKLLETAVLKAGIKLESDAHIKEIIGDDSVRSVLLEDGRSIKSELLIITTGVRSNSYIARLAGLEVSRGIVVNNFLESSDNSIYAAGDVAEHHGMSYGTWGPSQFQGTIAGMNAAGNISEFAGIPRSNLLKVLGYDLFSIGQIRGEDASFRSMEHSGINSYSYFYFHDNHLIGTILMGDSALSASVKNTIEDKIDCSRFIADNDCEKFILWLSS